MEKRTSPKAPRFRFCDSCDNPIHYDKWRCPKCNAIFCFSCGQDFGKIARKVFPECPVCAVRLELKGEVKLLLDKKAVLKCFRSTNLKDQDEEEICQRIARIFHKDIIYARQIWSTVKCEHFILIAQINKGIRPEMKTLYRTRKESRCI